MPMKWEDYREIAQEMVEDDSDRDAMFTAIDNLVHMEDALPPEWAALGWIMLIKSTVPYDIIHAAVRALATKEPQVNITPLANNPETRAHFNTMEKALKWAYKQAAQRSHGDPTRDIVDSIMRYDEGAAQVVYLPYQDRNLRAIKGKALKRAASYGKFAINVHNPRTVHTRYSSYMPEAVLLKKEMKVYEISKFWGDLAKELAEAYDDEMTECVTLYDYTDDEVRCVWAEADDESNGNSGKFVIVKPTEHKLGFLPWACRYGGTAMDAESNRSRQPILYSNYKTNAYHQQNMAGSLMFSLTLARATLPVDEVITPTGDGMDVDATQPAGQYAHGPSEKVIRMPPAGIDPGVERMYDRLSSQQSTSAATKVLQTGEVPTGAAFASINAIMKAATGALDMPKKTSEALLGDIHRLIVAWSKWDKQPLTFYEADQKAQNYGQGTRVAYDEIPEQENLYLDVKLETYVPTDEMSRVNAAGMLVQNLKFPLGRALEYIGVNDAETVMSEWEEEQKRIATVQAEVQEIMMEGQAMAQMRIQKLQQAAMQQDQQNQQAQQGQGQTPPGTGPGEIPFGGMQGQGFNPAEGGTPPGMGAPGMTREALGGQGAVAPNAMQPNIAAQGADMRGLGMNVPEMLGRKAVQ